MSKKHIVFRANALSGEALRTQRAPPLKNMRKNNNFNSIYYEKTYILMYIIPAIPEREDVGRQHAL